MEKEVLPSLSSYCLPHNRPKIKRQVIGARKKETLLATSAENGGLVAQITILPGFHRSFFNNDLFHRSSSRSGSGGGLQRNAAKLVAEVASGWLQALRPGAGVALAYNSLTTPRHQLAQAMEQAGFEVLPQVEGLEHRVDQSILRDVLVARKPK